MTPPSRAAIIENDIAAIKKAVEHIEEVVITGNGEPALREQVRTLSRWVGNVNKLALVIFVSAVGVSVPLSCGIFFGIVILLYNNGLFKIP